MPSRAVLGDLQVEPGLCRGGHSHGHGLAAEPRVAVEKCWVCISPRQPQRWEFRIPQMERADQESLGRAAGMRGRALSHEHLLAVCCGQHGNQVWVCGGAEGLLGVVKRCSLSSA